MNGTGNGNVVDNKSEIKVIVRTLAGILVLCVFGDLVLVYTDKKIPTELWLLTSNSFTALATMLVKTNATVSTAEDKSTEPKPIGDIKVPEQELKTTT